MAERRMFTKKVTDDDNFLGLSSSAQALYLHLSMAADDDGFCNQVTASMFKAHASVQDLESLLAQRYLYQFDNGVIVIKHWRMANALRKDRYTPTAFQEELAKLAIKENGSYTMRDPDLVAKWLPNGCQMVATGKDSIDKDRLGNNTTGDFGAVVEAWNSIGLTTIREIKPDSTRGKMTKARIKEYGLDEILRAIELVRNSSFLCGGGERGWQATYDWFIAPANFQKVIEGTYIRNEQPKEQPKPLQVQTHAGKAEMKKYVQRLKNRGQT